MSRGFGSDNHSGVHPQILAAIAKANVDHQPSYGTDVLSLRCDEMFRDIFGSEAEAFFVFNGTAANVLCLAQVVESYQTVLTTSVAHMNVDECGAPEKNLGARLIGIDTSDGKLTPEALKPYLIRRGDQHFSQVSAISVTQSTELGLVYSAQELKSLSTFAKSHGLMLHMDGSRLVNAAASLGVGLRELTTDCGIDVLSLGGTKNGLLFGEAVLFLRKGLGDGFKYRRKQMMQLPSKTRFIAAQFLEFLGTDLWKTNAHHANHMAQLLYQGLKNSRELKVTRVPQANAVFASIPKRFISALREVSFFYVWDEQTFECRLMTTWDTQVSDIERFLSAVHDLES